MKNLKKLVYQYNFLKLELDDVREEHSTLNVEFESLFSNVIPKDTTTAEDVIAEALASENQDKPQLEHIDNSTKKIYKDVAKKLHPDRGGDGELFRELNDRYKKNDLLGVVSMAVDNGVEFDISDEESEQLQKSILEIQNQIEHYKTTIAYVWKHGNRMQRYGVLQSLANHFGKKIDVNELDDEIKKMLQ